MGGCRSRDGRPRWASAVELGGGREKEMRSQTSLRHTEASRRPPAGTRHRACAVAATQPRAQVESVVARWAPAGHPTRRPLGTRSPGSTQGGLDTPQTPAEPQGCPGIAPLCPVPRHLPPHPAAATRHPRSSEADLSGRGFPTHLSDPRHQPADPRLPHEPAAPAHPRDRAPRCRGDPGTVQLAEVGDEGRRVAREDKTRFPGERATGRGPRASNGAEGTAAAWEPSPRAEQRCQGGFVPARSRGEDPSSHPHLLPSSRRPAVAGAQSSSSRGRSGAGGEEREGGFFFGAWFARRSEESRFGSTRRSGGAAGNGNLVSRSSGFAFPQPDACKGGGKLTFLMGR